MPQSARLSALRVDPGALARFWGEVEATGAPLVEPIEGDPDHVKVTFVWRGESGTRGVSLMHGPEGHDLHAHRLERLGDTDLWYHTCRVSSAARTEYAFAIDPPLEPDCDSDWSLHGERGERFSRAWSARQRDPGAVRLDPYNRSVDRVGETLGRAPPRYSYLELPAAPAEPWIVDRDGIARGTVERHALQSDALRQSRPFWVYVPPVETEAPFRLLLLFDGEVYRTDVPVPRVLDNLRAAGRIEPTLAVLVSSLGRQRRRDLAFSEPFVEFLTAELVPWLHATYRVTRDPARTVVGGSSLGGLAAAFRGRPLPGAVRERALTGRGVPSLARAPDGSRVRAGPRAAHERLRRVLAERGYVVRYNECPGGHDDLVWRGAFAEALLFLSR